MLRFTCWHSSKTMLAAAYVHRNYDTYQVLTTVVHVVCREFVGSFFSQIQAHNFFIFIAVLDFFVEVSPACFLCIVRTKVQCTLINHFVDSNTLPTD